MEQTRRFFNNRTLLLTTLSVLVVARLPMLLAGAEKHLSLMADDAFYYLEASRRTVETGSWPSMDGRHPTNGFHPLYFGALYALQKGIGTEPKKVVPLVFGLNLAMNAFAVAMIVFLLRKRLDNMAGVAAAGVLAMSPGWMAHGLAGVENSLSSILTLLIALRWITRFDEQVGIRLGPKAGGWWIDGLLMGLAMVARTDAAILCGIYLSTAYYLRRKQEPASQVIRDLALCTLVASLIVLPWLLVNLEHFGTITQDSAASLSVRFARLYREAGISAWLTLSVKNLAFWVYRLAWSWGLIPLTLYLIGVSIPILRIRKLESSLASPGLVALCAISMAIRANDPWYIDAPRQAAIELALGAAGFVAGVLVRHDDRLFLPRTVIFLFGWTAVLAFVYSVWLGSFQFWYTTAPALTSILLITLPALAALFQKQRNLALTLVILMAVQTTGRVQSYLARSAFKGVAPFVSLADGDSLRKQFEGLASTQRFRVGSFDSGELSYVVHPFPVTNLDGVMNHEACQAVLGNDLAGYLRTDGITHVIAFEERLEYFQGVSRFETRSDRELSKRLGVPIVRFKASSS